MVVSGAPAESPADSRSVDRRPGQEGEGLTESFPSCGDFDIRIARDGTWFYRGSPIGRHRLVKLFSTVIQRDDDGDFWMVTPAERGRIVVDDAPFVAVEMHREGEGREQRLRFRTNVDDWVTADAEHPIRVELRDAGAGGQGDDSGEEPAPYVRVRARLDALIRRSVFYELVEIAETDERGRLGVWSGGAFFPLDPLADTGDV